MISALLTRQGNRLCLRIDDEACPDRWEEFEVDASAVVELLTRVTDESQ